MMGWESWRRRNLGTIASLPRRRGAGVGGDPGAELISLEAQSG